LQDQVSLVFFTVLAVLIAVVMNFFIGSLLGMIAFWSPEVWAPRFIFFMLVSFFAGGMFPLDILPIPLQRIFAVLPFAYLQYFPISIYLGKVSPSGLLFGFGVALFWSIVLYFTVTIVWKRGLKQYSSEGN
jgi:ABC-2 type transport system permease protein